MYCKKCGGKIESYSSNCPFCGEAIANNNVDATYTSNSNVAKTNRGVGGWILAYIACGIPVVGIILLFIWAFGQETKNDLTFRNWARAQLILSLIAVIIIIFYVAIIVALVLSSGENIVLN